MNHKIENIRIVLCDTSHPGNIGATARAMKNMGLTQLVLVNPHKFPSAIATERAAGADDILQQARVTNTLTEAIGDCNLIFGTSTRTREIPWPKVSVKECAKKIFEDKDDAKVAILFGTERSGLTNEALSHCNYHLYIPANPNYESLNLSQAVQVISYEIYQHYLELINKEQKIENQDEAEMATLTDIMGVYDHLEQMLRKVEFIEPKSTRILILKLKRLLLKSRLELEEVNILRGIFKAIIQKVTKEEAL